MGNFRKIIPIIFAAVLIFTGLSFGTPQVKDSSGNSANDATKSIDAQAKKNYFKDVDVKIIYSWNPKEPDVYHGVSCRLIRQGNVVTQLNIFQEDETEEVEVKKGETTYQIVDPATNKVIAEGP